MTTELIVGKEHETQKEEIAVTKAETATEVVEVEHESEKEIAMNDI